MQIEIDLLTLLTSLSAIGASLLRLVFAVRLRSTADYSYVKAQSTLAGLAELALGVIASCLFILPRLYRHLVAVPPYGSEDYVNSRRKNTMNITQPEEKTKMQSALTSHVLGSRVLKVEGSRREAWQENVEALRPPVPPKPQFPKETYSKPAAMDPTFTFKRSKETESANFNKF